MNANPNKIGFKQWFDNQKKLADARREGRKRAKKKYDAEHNDEFKKLQSRTYHRVHHYGITPELPKLKAWDWAKGKVKP